MYLVWCLVSKDIKEKTHLKACNLFTGSYGFVHKPLYS